MIRQEPASVLVVDDEYSVRDSLENWFKKDGYRTGSAASGEEALRHLVSSQWDVLLVDVKMPGMDGLELQRRIREVEPDAVVIIITAYAAVDTAVQALKEGAFDYVTKPVDPDELSHLVRRAVEQKRLHAENVRLREDVQRLTAPAPIIGESPQMKKVVELVSSVAETDATVLIRGESGTGRELIAQSIHARGPRRFFSLVPVNCGALSETLLESELFGHEKGVFTGAHYGRKGKLELADGGTLLLAEIGAISPKTQVDLLRVLETKEFTRLGGTRPLRVDFRVIATTNQNLEKLVEDGQFLEDLRDRLSVFSIVVPPLRERPEDVPLLAKHFLDKLVQQMHKPFTDISAPAMRLLTRHGWPGNVRELQNCMERAMVVGTPPTIQADDLPLALSEPSSSSPSDTLAAIERAHIGRILERTQGDVTRAADILGIDRATLCNKIKEHGLPG